MSFVTPPSPHFVPMQRMRAKLALYRRVAVRINERIRVTESQVKTLEVAVREDSLVRAGYVKVVDGNSVGWSKDGWTIWGQTEC